MDDKQNVWIDRQEYDRLKALEQSGQPSQPVVMSGGEQPVPAQQAPNKLLIAFGIVGVISFIFPPAILLFLVLGLITIVKLIRNKAQGKKRIGALLLGVVIAGIVVVASPFLMLIGLLIFWQIGCATGLGSCTTA